MFSTRTIFIEIGIGFKNDVIQVTGKLGKEMSLRGKLTAQVYHPN
jgi:hypothetical protein